MKKYILTLSILTTTFFYSQERNESLSQGVNSFVSANVRPNGSGILVSGKIDPGVEGNPYLFDNWKTIATIHVEGGKMFTMTNFNYDTKLDRFVSKVSLDSVFVFQSSNLKEAVFNKKKFKRYNVNGLYSYYEVVAFAKGKEVLKRNLKIIKKGKQDPFTKKKNKDKYVLAEKYFLNSKEGMRDLKLKNSSFLKVFGNQSSQIKKYIKKNKLSIKDDIDIAKIFKYYNQI